jgi:predicted small secreted protein
LTGISAIVSDHFSGGYVMISPRRLILSVFLLSFATALAGCGDTWRGVKKDTGENMEKTGNAVENTGRKIQP